MNDNYSKARKLILDYLKGRNSNNSFSQGDLNYLLAPHSGLLLDKSTILQVLHDLYLDRIIVSGGFENSSPWGLDWSDGMRLTDFGKSISDIDEYDPYDAEDYRDRLISENPDIDENILLYLTESQNCLRHNYLLAAAVMLGCAAEKAMLLLIDGFGQAISDPKKRSKYENKTSEKRFIKVKYDEFSKQFKPIIPSLPDELRDEIDIKLDQIFNMIRRTRNDAGHPTGKFIYRDTIISNMILFPIYCKRLYLLIDYFKTNKI
ncbi:hypothetical protein J7L05_09540 [bacterium]|nr:hypothetical protein [bacterium]